MIKKYFLAFLGAFSVIGFVFFLCCETLNEYGSSKKILKFNYVITNTSNKLIDDAHFTLFLPSYIDDFQEFYSLSSSYNYQIKKDLYDLQAAKFDIGRMIPFSSKVIDFSLVVEVFNRPKKERINNELYLVSEKYIDLNSLSVQEIAGQLRGDTRNETAINIYDWLVNNIKESNYSASNKGATYLLKNKMGDCTELMYGFVALARANGVPARGVSGLWVASDVSMVNSADYHDWAEYHDGNRWVLVDVYKKNFDDNYLNYIQVSIFDKNFSGKRWVVSDDERMVLSH